MSRLDPSLLREIGEAWPGGSRGLAHWLAARNGKDGESVRRSLSRYEAGQHPLPGWLGGELRAAIDHQILWLRALRKKLRS